MDESEPKQKPLISGAISMDLDTLNCRIFQGSYYIPPHAAFSPEFNFATQVVCKCPGMLDYSLIN